MTAFIFAIWDATDPTAPNAAETKTVSLPSFNLPILKSPIYAVSPVIPNTPKNDCIGAVFELIFKISLPFENQYSLHPKFSRTYSPTVNSLFLDSITCPTHHHQRAYLVEMKRCSS